MRTAQDGTELYLHAHPVPSPRATLLVLHGYGEHAGRYDHVAKALAPMGIQTFAVDLRGHGRSRGQRGFVRRFDEYHQDAEALLAVGREVASGTPLFLFGHSMGGLVALHYLLGKQPAPVKGLLLSSPFLGVALKVPALKILLGKVASQLVPSLALPSGLHGHDVTRDPDLARLYDQDPLNNKDATARWYTEAMAAIESVQARASELKLPTILLYGGADKVADAAATDRLAAALTMPDRTVDRLAGYFHELVNEPPEDRARVIERFGRWILEHA